MNRRTQQDWDNVYDVLVTEAGARESNRHRFVHFCLTNTLVEWLFEGRLGPGGKIWQKNGRLSVTCYRETETTKKLAIISRVNHLLSKL